MHSRVLALALSFLVVQVTWGEGLRFFDCRRTGEAVEDTRGEKATIILGGELATVQTGIYATDLFRCTSEGKVVTCERGENDHLTFSILGLSAVRTLKDAGRPGRTLTYACVQFHQ
jgi:hypothetical protein